MCQSVRPAPLATLGRMSEPRRRATPEEVRALSHPLRLRILSLCHGESLSNKEISERLHAQPATVLYHVRTLVRTGFLVAEADRPGPRGSRLRPYRATDKSWTIDVGGPSETGGAKLTATRPRSSAPWCCSPCAPPGPSWSRWSTAW